LIPSDAFDAAHSSTFPREKWMALLPRAAPSPALRCGPAMRSESKGYPMAPNQRGWTTSKSCRRGTNRKRLVQSEGRQTRLKSRARRTSVRRIGDETARPSQKPAISSRPGRPKGWLQRRSAAPTKPAWFTRRNVETPVGDSSRVYLVVLSAGGTRDL
jgi:hypothetical protein